MSISLAQMANNPGVGLVVFALALFVPLGLLLMAVGATPPERAKQLAAMGMVTFVGGALAYLLLGFGIQFGGLGLVNSADWAASWAREWSPLDLSLGPGWGVVGLRFVPLLWQPQAGEVYALAFLHAIAAGTAGMIPVLALAGRKRPLVAFLPALTISALLYPLAGNWVWGGGWLENMGQTLSLGHGTVDLAGAGPVHVLGGAMALALFVTLGPDASEADPDAPIAIPPIHFPLFRLLGLLLALVGWMAWAVALPLQETGTPVSLLALNLFLAAGAGAFLAGLYTGFVTGTPDVLLTLQGSVAALVAGSALVAFVHPWGALSTGAFAGLLACLGTYALERWFRLRDVTATIAAHLLGGAWGLLALGLFASGRFGQGWQGTGVTEYLGLVGQGVTGALVGRGVQPDWPGQFYAQVVAVFALLVIGYLVPAFVISSLRRLFTAPLETAAEEPRPAPAGPTPAQAAAAADPLSAGKPDDLPESIAAEAEPTSAEETEATADHATPPEETRLGEGDATPEGATAEEPSGKAQVTPDEDEPPRPIPSLAVRLLEQKELPLHGADEAQAEENEA